MHGEPSNMFGKLTAEQVLEQQMRNKGFGHTLDDLRWNLLQSALSSNWREYENIRVKLNGLGAEIPPRSTV